MVKHYTWNDARTKCLYQFQFVTAGRYQATSAVRSVAVRVDKAVEIQRKQGSEAESTYRYESYL